MGRKGQAETYLNVQAFDVWTPDSAYAIGLFYTDGHLGQNDSSTYTVSFYNTDYPTVEWWHGFLGNQTKIHERIVRPGEGRNLSLFSSTATSNLLGCRLIELGAGLRKSWADLRIPDMPPECLPHFLRGFNDGDGCVCFVRNRKMKGGFNLRVPIVSNSQTFRSDLRLLFNSKGWHPETGGIRVVLNGSDAEQFCQWIYGCGGQAMARKKAKWEEWQGLRRPFGGLICEIDPYETLRGVQPKEWHRLAGTMTDRELARISGVSFSRVSQYRLAVGIPRFVPCGAQHQGAA